MNGQISGHDSKIKELSEEHIKHQNILRAKRGEQKELQILLDKERVNKFGSLVKTGDEKYTYLTMVARIILRLLGNTIEDTGAPDVSLFLDFDQFKLKLNTRDPLAVSKEDAESSQTQLNDHKDKYTKKGAPAQFKKTFKYDSVHNWAAKFVEVVIAAHEVEESRKGVEACEIQKLETNVKIENYQQCLQDLDIFDFENLQQEQSQLQNLVFKLKDDNAMNLTIRQQRYQNFEQNYFALINQYKRKAMSSNA